MQKLQNNQRESIINARDFLDEHADKLAGVATIGLRKKLDAAIAELDDLAVGQGGGTLTARQSTVKHRSLREALLRDHMGKIAGVAHTELPDTPEVAPMRLPRGRPTAQNLAHAAEAMAVAAMPYRDVFVSAGLPDDFIAQLTGASDAMLESLRHRTRTLGKRIGSTTGLGHGLRAARKIVKGLDRFVSSALRNDPTLRSDWKALLKVRRPTRIPAVQPIPVTAAASGSAL